MSTERTSVLTQNTEMREKKASIKTSTNASEIEDKSVKCCCIIF